MAAYNIHRLRDQKGKKSPTSEFKTPAPNDVLQIWICMKHACVCVCVHVIYMVVACHV